jgi:hypothetical protein
MTAALEGFEVDVGLACDVGDVSLWMVAAAARTGVVVPRMRRDVIDSWRWRPATW